MNLTAQQLTIVHWLRSHEYLENGWEMMAELGQTKFATRIGELIEKGFDIEKSYTPGKKTKRYKLISEPEIKPSYLATHQQGRQMAKLFG